MIYEGDKLQKATVFIVLYLSQYTIIHKHI